MSSVCALCAAQSATPLCAPCVAQHRADNAPKKPPRKPRTPLTEKRCTECQRTKPVHAFYTHKRDGWRSVCIYCTKQAAAERTAERVAAREARKPEVQARRRERNREYARRKRASPEYATQRRAERARVYGMTVEEVDVLYAIQGGRCGCCDRPLRGGRTEAIDHCHATGKVRGILCFHCNTGVGKLGDNAAGVRRALKYLERFENNHQPGGPR